MRRISMIISDALALSALVFAVSSCSDWNDHYDAGAGSQQSSNLYETLAKDAETTDFAALAARLGYDKTLSSSQTYTVFAPTNEALAGVDLSDDVTSRRLVANHIARYTIPTSTGTVQGVKMLTGKNYYFDSADCFQGCSIEDANIRTKNGIVHHVNGIIPYSYNILEYIKETPGFSKLYSFISRFDETKFDEEHSVETGIDDEGRPVYDSIMVNYNRLLEDKVYGIGHIADEDSLYTVLLPDNDAWDKAYDRISPYYKVCGADAEYADSVRDVRTGLAILSDLVYRGKDANPGDKDSLVSTTGSVIHSPNGLFAAAERHDVSNGYVFTVADLAYNNVETWNKEVSVEAEEQNGRNYNNTTTSVYTRTLKNESLVTGISGDSYIEVQPNTSATNPTVQFEIPNVLAGKYNIYAVLLPATVDGSTAELDSTVVSFTLYYSNADGRVVNKKNTSKTLVTNSREVTKMLAFQEFEFPVSDYTDRLWLTDDNNNAEDVETKTSMTVSTNVTTKEYSSKKYSRTFRLDRIVLEPIKN